jgi:hypothetical protein
MENTHQRGQRRGVEGREARVLLVEDDERIRQALGLALQMRATRSARHSLRPNPNRDTGQVVRSEP